MRHRTVRPPHSRSPHSRSPGRRSSRLRAADLTAAVTLAAGLLVGLPGTAGAQGVALFDQAFTGPTADGDGAVVIPATADGAPNQACLTAAVDGAVGVLPGCTGPQGGDPAGEGALSLTAAQGWQVGGLFAATSVPTGNGLDVSFTMHQFSDETDPADGLVFALAAVDPAAPTSPPTLGRVGGSLGYSAGLGTAGLAHGYLGIGFDSYGNFSTPDYQGTDCPASPYARYPRTPGQVVVRGPGDQTSGYCAVNSTATSAEVDRIAFRGTTRQNSAVPVRVLINDKATPVTTADGITVAARSYLTRFSPVGSSSIDLTGALPQMTADQVGDAAWLDDGGLPKQLAFGWVASTGGFVDNHQITDARVASLSGAVAQLTVVTSSHTPGPELQAGDPVGYVVTPGVAAGVDEAGPVSVTVTAPPGVVPLGADGPGWSCAPPVGQKVTCATGAGPFTAGTTLPAVTVTATATGPVTADTVETATVTTASSDDALAAYSDRAPSGTNPPTPTVTAVTPDVGLATGGGTVTISGTDLATVSALTVGTAAEQAAGTAVPIRPCSATVPAPCFTVSGDQLVVQDWPAHAVGTVTVSVIALGTAAASTYRYVAFTEGALLITEFRMSGPAGADDDYVELTNTTSGPLPMDAVTVATSSGRTSTLPAQSPVLPAGGSYLLVGSSYSLGAVATPDQREAGGLGSGGVRVVAPDGLVVDAVGPVGAAVDFRQGAGLPAMSGEPDAEFGWVRTQQTGTFKSTGDNAADFALVSTSGDRVGGVQSMLGSPSPTGMTDPWNRSSVLTSTLLDPSRTADQVPNRVITKVGGVPGGRIEVRRVVTNTTEETVTALQLRLIDITEANGLAPLTASPSVALLRSVGPQSAAVTVNGVTVTNVQPAAPSSPSVGGGLNSTLQVPLPPGGLAPGQTATVGLTFAASTNGRYSFRYATEALLG